MNRHRKRLQNQQLPNLAPAHPDRALLSAQGERPFGPRAPERAQGADPGLRLGEEKGGDAPGGEPRRFRRRRLLLEDAVEEVPASPRGERRRG